MKTEKKIVDPKNEEQRYAIPNCSLTLLNGRRGNSCDWAELISPFKEGLVLLVNNNILELDSILNFIFRPLSSPDHVLEWDL